jgi:hypothetical protein
MTEINPEGELAAELAAVDAEPLLPVEKKLIAWSLGLGVSLLILLGLANRFLPVG